MKRGIGLKAKILVGVLALSVCFSACGKISVQSDTAATKYTHQQPAADECYAKITDTANPITVENSNRTVSVYIDDIVPDSYPEHLPVVRVKPHSITSEECRLFAEKLLGNAQFYETSINPVMAKATAKEKIADWERLNKAEVLRDIYGESQMRQVQDALQQSIDSLKNTGQFEKGETGHKMCGWEFHPEEYYSPNTYDEAIDNGSKTIMAYAEKGDVGYKLWLTNRDEADYRVQNLSLYLTSEYASPWDIETLHMVRTLCGNQKPSDNDVDRVIEKAKDLLNDTVLGEWVMVDADVEVYKYWHNRDNPAYVISVTAVPNYGGINLLHFDQLESLKNKDATNYYYSELILTFSTGGELIEALLTSPLDRVSETNPNEKAIDSQQTMDILVNHLQNIEPISFDAVMGDQKGCTIKAEIDNAEFGLARIRSKDNKNEFDLVPAVQFSGDYNVMLNGESLYSYREMYGKDYEFAVINIVDGSIINTRLGY